MLEEIVREDYDQRNNRIVVSQGDKIRSIGYTLPLEEDSLRISESESRVSEESSLDISLSHSRKLCSRCMIRKTKWLFQIHSWDSITMPFRLCFKCMQEFPIMLEQFRSEY